MSEIDLHKEYNSSGESIQDLFDRTEEGFFVPLYQREYTWEEDNINQMFDDLVLGTRELSKNENVTTFLGTTITTTLGNKKQTVKEGHERAQPTGVQTIIDGQQRISTLALISIQIIVKLRVLQDKLPQRAPYADFHNAAAEFIERLTKIHTIRLGRGAEPPLKPKIIWAGRDFWTYDGDDTSYGSPVARYIATFIRTGNAQTAVNALDLETGSRVRANVSLVDAWLGAVCNAHILGTDMYEQFPVGSRITTNRMQEHILGFTSHDVKDIVGKAESDSDRNDYRATAIYQLLLLTHYLLRRCGVNRLQPTHEEWGFDMFQALNATGTPLTVMETFLPQVMQAEVMAGNEWERTTSCELIDDTQELFEATTTNEQKTRRTNELLRTFSLCYEGKKLGNKFSEQRRWLTQVFEQQLPTIDQKREFLSKLARTAKFFYFGWYMEGTTRTNHIRGFEDHPQGGFVSLLVRYLRDANSRLSAPILARFYSQALDGQTTFDEFLESAKACTAFFTLWRTANSTSGLDDIYRKYFQGSDAPVAVGRHSWKEHPEPLTAKNLKQYFIKVLDEKRISDKERWIRASERFLLFTELKTICRFVLFVAGHDRVVDESDPGLTDTGTEASCTLLELGRWVADDHKSLEHVAPQRPPIGHKWDPKFYADDLVHQIGNLILLPLDLNKFVDNKEWAVKYLHYCHVGKRNKNELKKLSDVARREGIVLSKKATDKLSNARYNCAVEPILRVGKTGNWDAELVAKRTRQIKELAWETLFRWLRS